MRNRAHQNLTGFVVLSAVWRAEATADRWAAVHMGTWTRQLGYLAALAAGHSPARNHGARPEKCLCGWGGLGPSNSGSVSRICDSRSSGAVLTGFRPSGS